MKKLFFPFIILFITACNFQGTTLEEQRWQERANNVEIIRDDFGVPHIYGKTDADAVFGLLYAQCEDDFRRVERNYTWAIGRLAEVEGERMLYSDLRAKLYMTEAEAIERFESAPKWLKELCIAFADGINFYLDTHPEVEPYVIKHYEPWMPMYFSEGSIGGDIERVSTRKIKDFYAPKDDVIAANGLIRPNDQEPRGSNGFAISGDLTESGNAMLLINPHTSFFFRGEVHVVSEEGLNAYGAVTWGQFFVYQGFNEKTGWMHTSTYTDIIDEFVEDVSETEKGLYYKYGEEYREVFSEDVKLKYLENGEMKEKTFTMYRTHHGPITHSIDGKWVATALMWDPVNALIQSYTRTKKDGHMAFREMMNIRTNSSNNTVYADAEGNIAYYHGNFIPRRDVQFDYTKPVDGSNPATDWQGLHEVDENILVVNPPNGWIQNCNSTPFTCADEYSPKVEDYPKYMSANNETFRGVHAIRLLKKADDLTLDKLIELAYDPYLPAFEVLIPGMLEAYNKYPDKDLKEAVDILKKWDFAVQIDSEAMSIAHYIGSHTNRYKAFPKGLNRMERITYMANEAPLKDRIQVFKAAVNELKEDFGSVNTPWGEINRFQRVNGEIRQPFNDDLPSIPIGLASGRWGALASYGARKYEGTKRIYGTSGNSFVAVVEFGEKVKAKTMLAGGQKCDPNSPHFDDQLQRYADVAFKDAAYYREDVEKRMKNRYRPGQR